MNLRFAFAGVCLLLASSGLFAASGAPQSVPFALAVAAVLGAVAAAARVSLGQRPA